MGVGNNIKYLRKRNNLTQQELADLIGVQRASIQKYEDGSVQNLKLETVQNLCSVFQVTPIAFVFPDKWKATQMASRHSISDFHKAAEVYYGLTDDGKRKVLEYIHLVGQAEQHDRKGRSDK